MLSAEHNSDVCYSEARRNFKPAKFVISTDELCTTTFEYAKVLKNFGIYQKILDNKMSWKDYLNILIAAALVYLIFCIYYR